MAAGVAFGEEGSDRLKDLRAHYARKAGQAALKYINGKCFFVGKEYVRLGESFDPQDPYLVRLKEYLAFVPTLPWQNYPKPLAFDSLPESEDLTRRGHNPRDDASLMNVFWRKNHDRFLCDYLEHLDRTLKKAGKGQAAGEAYIIVAALEERVPSWGRKKAFELARKALEDLGWRFGRFKYKWPRWLNPSEVREAEERDRFEKGRDKRRKKVLQGFADAMAGRALSAPSNLAQGLGLSMARRATDRFEVEGGLEQKDLAVLLGLFEACLARAAVRLGLPLPAPSKEPLRMILLGSEKEYARFADGIEELTAQGREAVKTLSSGYADFGRGCFGCFREDASFLVNAAMGMLKLGFERLGLFNLPLWLWAGLADCVLIDVLGDCAPSLGCARRTASPSYQAWYDFQRWGADMARAQEKGLGVSASSVLARENEFEVAPVQRAAMATLVSFLLSGETPCKEVLGYVSKKGWAMADDGEYPALKAGGWTLRSFETAWTAYLQKVYPPKGR
jgi:hypothetical protein